MRELWELLTKIGVASLLSIMAMREAGKIVGEELKLNKKSIAWIGMMVIATVVPYEVEYKMIATVITYFLTIFSSNRIYGLGLNKAVTVSTIVMTLIGVIDMIVSGLLMIGLKYEDMREMNMMVLSNLIVIVTMNVLFEIRSVTERFKKYVDQIDAKKNSTKVIFVLLTFLIIIMFFCNVIPKGITSMNYMANFIIVLIFIVLNAMYIEEENNYTNLMIEYDVLFECVKNFEEWIEEEQMNMHESKNSLASLLDIESIEGIKRKIRSMINAQIEIEDKWIDQLKYVPKGGLKGILYYKLSLAKQNNIEVMSDVSSTVEPIIEALNENERKELSRLVGIYFDNAIEAAKEVKKGKISMELYTIKEDLVLVFSNNYKGKININKMNEKGVSSKGEGRGKGLYFAKKIIKRNERFIGEQRIIKGYYIQKLTVRRNKNKKILRELS